MKKIIQFKYCNQTGQTLTLQRRKKNFLTGRKRILTSGLYLLNAEPALFQNMIRDEP